MNKKPTLPTIAPAVLCFLLLAPCARAQTPFGNALLFNAASNQYVTVSNFGGIIPTNEITVEFWANPNAFAGQSAFQLSPDQGNNRLNAHIDYSPSPGTTYWDFGNISAGGRVFATSPVNSVGSWTHYALVASQSGNYMRIYTNGVLQVSQSGMTPFVRGNYNLQIAGPGFPFTGQLDELRIWSVARTPAQIQADLYSIPSGDESNLVVYYKFDSANGTVATNSATATGSAFNGTLTNGPTWVASTIPLVVYTVTNAADSGPGTLRNVVSNAPGGAIITFAPALSGQVITLTNGPIVLANNVTIDAGALDNALQINPNYQSRIFTVNNATVVLNSLTLTNGNAQFDKGGSILNNSGIVTVNNCFFIENAAYDGAGGAIANTSGAMTVNNCTFVYNFATITTGYSSLRNSTGGGAIYNAQGHLTVNSCTFMDNYGDGGEGGGAIWCTGAFPVTANNCTFASNSAVGTTGGGAICDQSGAALVVNSCTFVGNTATNSSAGGGGIYASGNLNLTNSIVCSNSAATGAHVYCGGVFTEINSLISVGSGSAVPSLIYYHNGFISSGEVDTTNALLAPLGNYGGPTQTMLPLPGSPAIDAGNDSVTSFLTTDQRGLPRKTGAHVDIGAVEVQPSDTNTLVTTTADFGSGSLRMAALLVNLGVPNPITFSSVLSGQTILLTSGQIVLNTNVTVDASSLTSGIQINGNNQSRIFEITNNATVVLKSLTVANGNDDNDTNYGGGGILNFGTLSMTNCNVSGNNASFSADGGDGIDNNGTLTVSNCIISDNGVGASPSGGGIASYHTLTVNNCTIINNETSVGGGGVCSTGTATINNSTISGNYSKSGGGIYVYGAGGATVNNSTIVGNQADFLGGGGIFLQASVMSVNNSTIIGNLVIDSELGGGGICNSGTLTVNSSTITGNQVAHSSDGGGGILNFSYSGTPVLSLTNCIVYSNSATLDTMGGPELENNGGTMTVAYCLLGPEGLASFYTLNSGGTTLTNTTIAVNPLLAPLGNYGGPTQTMPPEPGSPALGAGNVTAASQFSTDQRGTGFARVVSGKVDIGAVEDQSGQYYSIVANTLDAGPGSLRQVISNAPAGATVTFDSSLSGQAITLTSGQIVLSNAVYIYGTGLDNGIQINGNGSSRIFQVNTGTTAILDGLTLTNGNPGANPGGAIYNTSGTLLELVACTLAGNSSSQGGAIENQGTCVLFECTLTGNHASGNGGAIDNNQGPLQLLQCTLVGNTASGSSGGVANYLNTLAMTNCIVAGNNAADIYNFGSSTINAGGTNLVQSYGNAGTINGISSLVSKAPLLASLGNYGGLTPTMPPQHGSPAIDGGSTAAEAAEGFTVDQRGYPRVSGARVDIGAVEVQIAPANFSLMEFTRQTNGIIQFSLPSLVGGSFTVFASTNVALPFNTWSNLGPVLEMPVGSGDFQFTDTHATNFSRRFYRVSSP